MIGKSISHYRVTEKLGAGGMGEVYRAHDERLDRDVALKVLPAHTLADETARKRFRKEALALSKLNHPNIATIHNFDTQDGMDFLVMEDVEGTTLAERVAKGAPADAQLLLRPGDNSWDGLRDDIGFRVGTYGHMEFTIDGTDYFVQYYPVGMAAIQSPPELMLAQMGYAGISHCVLQAGPTYGMMNDYNAYAQNAHPTKFTGLLHVDDAMAYTPRWMEEVERAYHRLGLRGLYYAVDSFDRYRFQGAFNDARMSPFWELIASLDIPVFMELNAA